MATKYWTANQTTATVPTANTASNWNTAADGTGSTGVPGTTDDCVFGHQDTLDANLGNAECVWDLTQVNSITVNEGYRTAEHESDTRSFKASTRKITDTEYNFELLGFRQGMYIQVSGSASNDGEYEISAISDGEITVAGVLVDESAGQDVTISVSSSIDMQASTCTINDLSLDGVLKNTSGSNKTLRFEGTPGTNNWYITNGPNAQVLNQDDLTYNFNSAQTISFDDGPYPKVTVTAAAALQWDYKAAPTSSVHGAVSFYSLNVSDSSATATGTLNDPRNDFKKVFKVLTTAGFGFSPSRFDAGFSTWHFKPDASFSIPVTGSLLYGAADGSFTAAWYNLVLDEPDTAGEICTVDAGRTLNLNSLTVESGIQMQGYTVKGAGLTSTVVCINRPTINGAWNFSQVAEGIYSSIVTDTHPFTPSHGAAGRVQFSDYGGKFFSDPKLTWTTSSSTLTVDGKLTVTGLIDPTGLVLSEVGTDPASTGAGEGTIWVKSTTPTTLYFTDSAGSDHQLGTGGGGGGSGTVTSIATTAPITGGTITTTGTIGISAATTSAAGSMSSADKTKLDGIETNADVTDATNVAAAGAIMDSDFSANGLMERTGSGSYTINTDIIQTEHLAIDYATGWWTFAVVKGWDALGGSSSQRAMSQFYIQDKRSSRHRTARIEASHQFGVDGSNSLTCFAVSGYGNEIPFTEFRIKEGSTYDGAALQIYISNSLNDLSLHMIFNLGTGDGWTLLSTMLADSDTSGHDALLGDTSRTYVDFATSMTVKKTLDIEEIGFVDANSGGGIATTGGLVVQGSARISGTLRQSVTNAVLVADANGDLAPASNLTDDVFVQAGSAGQDPFNITPPGAPTDWAGAPPATIDEAISRLAAWAQTAIPGPIP